MKNLATVLAVGLFLVALVGCQNWRWNECRKVGHGKLYCLMEMGR